MVFKDWVGSAWLHEDIAHGRQLEELAGVDRRRWIVVGITVEPCAAQGDEQVSVLVVDKHSMGLDDTVDVIGALVRYSDEHGAIPAQRLPLADTGLDEILDQMKHAQITLRLNRLQDTAFTVTR
jgi:hypothetical protein